MSPEQALARIEALCDEPRPWDENDADSAEARAARAYNRALLDVRAVLAEVQPRYWLAPQVDGLVEAYKLGDLGRVHRIIDLIIDRDTSERRS